MTVNRRTFMQGSALLSGSALGVYLSDGEAAESQRRNGNPTFSDPLFNAPYIDKDEWRDTPVRLRYVHGGFTGTEAKFSFYFPPKEHYRGRFFQYVTPVPAHENSDEANAGENSHIGFSVSSGGYFVQSNQGGLAATGSPGSNIDATIAGYRINAAAAQYSRVLAAQMYGPHRTYGYVWGGSGGSYRAISGFENSDAWDGAVPFIMGSNQSIPSMFTVRLHALRVVGDKLAGVVDALDPGGSGDMYAGLNQEEREALQEATRMGFPPETWFLYRTLGWGPFSNLFDLVEKLDPGYFEDFWKVAGYLGASPPASLAAARLQHRASVTRVIMTTDAASVGLPGPSGPQASMRPKVDAATAWKNFQDQYGGRPFPVAYQLESAPTGRSLEGASILIQTGAGAGGSVSAAALVNDMVTILFTPVSGTHAEITSAVRPGDEVQIDNSKFLAVQTYHRHQVSTPDYYVWDQYRKPDGTPRYPQRPRLLGPMFTMGAGGSIMTGRFKGKMIVVESLMDEDALPWQADWYARKVQGNLGSRFNDNYRLWVTENALHINPPAYTGQSDNVRVVNYLGMLYQALRDVSAWVERGVAPPQSSHYRIDDGRMTLPAAAADRKGVQPVVRLTANGGERVQVRVGEPVQFSGVIEAPPNTGKIVAAEWDFDGSGSFAESESALATAQRVQVTKTHSFPSPGTYFVVLRGTAQRDGDAITPYARLRNIGRARVVVT